MNLAAIALALVAGAFFGLTAHLQRAALPHADARLGALITIATMAAVTCALAPLAVDPAWLWTRAAAIFALCGLIFPAASQTLQIRSVSRVGPALTSAMGSFAPLFAVLPAIVLLGEKLNLQGWAGMALLMGGLMLSALGPRRGIPRSWPLAMILLPLGASLARGIVQPISKIGLLEVPSPLFATLVMACVSTLVLALPFLSPRVRRGSRANRTGIGIFMLNGLVVAFGILSLNAAISVGTVTLAAPLASTAPLFTLLFGVLFFRNETLGPRHLVIALAVVIGAALLVTR